MQSERDVNTLSDGRGNFKIDVTLHVLLINTDAVYTPAQYFIGLLVTFGSVLAS